MVYNLAQLCDSIHSIGVVELDIQQTNKDNLFTSKDSCVGISEQLQTLKL